jgi:hypothetical protein
MRDAVNSQSIHKKYLESFLRKQGDLPDKIRNAYQNLPEIRFYFFLTVNRGNYIARCILFRNAVITRKNIIRKSYMKIIEN